MKKGFFKRYGSASVNKKDQTKPTPGNEQDNKSTGIFNLAKNLSNSLIQWNRAGRPVVNNEQWNKRLTICRQCQYWEEIGNSQIAR